MALTEKVIMAYALKNAVEHNGKAVVASVVNSLFNEGLKKEKIKDVLPEIQKTINKVNNLSQSEQEKEFEKLESLIGHRETREGLPELENADKGVVMRFRPAPSGPLHLGHIISGLPSSLYAEKYGGKFYIIIDDTNPEETLKDSYENIKKDFDWIFGNVYKYLNASDRIEIYYKYAEKLIEKEKAYVCDCNPEEFKKLILNKKPCLAENLVKMSK